MRDVVKQARFLGQHDRDAVTHGKGKAGLPADQLLCSAVVGKRAFADRANQDGQQAGVETRGVRHGDAL